MRAAQQAKIDPVVFHQLWRNVAQYAPKIGDILQNNRGHGAYTFQYAATLRSYPSHCAIVMEVGVDSKGNCLQTIGGNESDQNGL